MLMPKSEDWSGTSGIGGPWGESAHTVWEQGLGVSVRVQNPNGAPSPLFLHLCAVVSQVWLS